jgi:Ca2+-binding RTX toxin-like protein
MFVIPATANDPAEDVFEVDIIKCGVPGTSEGCGSNPEATDPLKEGDVEVDDKGNVRVELKGAAANTTYTVFVGNWVTGGGFQMQFLGSGTACSGEIGTVETNSNGDFEGPVTTESGGNFAFPEKTFIGQPNFIFNNPACTQTQFTTGFRIENEEIMGTIFCQPGIQCVGTNKSDIIIGTEGDDEIDGGNGNDIIFGHAGNDKIRGGNGNDTLDGGDGNDELKGGNGTDVLTGGNDNDILEGENGFDVLIGGDGNDTLNGGNGADTLDGGLGDDDIKGENGPDTITCGDGSDKANGGKGVDVISPDCEDVK